jgi:hypothetical protein
VFVDLYVAFHSGKRSLSGEWWKTVNALTGVSSPANAKRFSLICIQSRSVYYDPHDTADPEQLFKAVTMVSAPLGGAIVVGCSSFELRRSVHSWA